MLRWISLECFYSFCFSYFFLCCVVEFWAPFTFRFFFLGCKQFTCSWSSIFTLLDCYFSQRVNGFLHTLCVCVWNKNTASSENSVLGSSQFAVCVGIYDACIVEFFICFRFVRIWCIHSYSQILNCLCMALITWLKIIQFNWIWKGSDLFFIFILFFWQFNIALTWVEQKTIVFFQFFHSYAIFIWFGNLPCHSWNSNTVFACMSADSQWRPIQFSFDYWCFLDLFFSLFKVVVPFTF